MAKKKHYIIRKTRKGRVNDIEGDLEHLKNFFSYTLMVGNSIDRTINTKPKTIISLVGNLRRAYDAKEASCYERTSIDLIFKDEKYRKEKALEEALDAIEKSDEAESCDACFDAGEFSSPAHARLLEKRLKEISEKYVVDVIELLNEAGDGEHDFYIKLGE